MIKPGFYFIGILSLIFSFSSKAGTIMPVDSSAQINQLIAKGIKYQDNQENSLSILTAQLRRMSTNTDNKRGLVFAQVFDMHNYWIAANHPLAMQTALHALADAERWKVSDALPDIYGTMANLHKETGNYPMAFSDNTKGINASKRIGDTANTINLLGQQAMFTHSFYLKKHKKQNDHSSLDLQFEAMKLAEANPKYEKLLIPIYDNISQAFKDKRDFNQAIFYGDKGAYLAKKYNRLRSLTYSYCWLGESYYYLGQHDKGINYINNAISIAQQLKQPYRVMELYEALYECYKTGGNYKAGLTLLERSATMRDSLQVAKNAKQVSELQVKFDSAKKDNEITILNELNRLKSRKLLWIMIGLPILLILLGIILYQNVVIHANNKVIKLKNNLLQQALDKIAYIQSHQTRKPLASIMGLMNIIKSDNYIADKETLLNMETATLDLDKNIREIITHTEIAELDEEQHWAVK